MTSLELADFIAPNDTLLQFNDALVLPALNLANIATEVEPNNKPEEATPLDPEQTVRGTLGDWDYFSFEVSDPPQRWLIEARGTNFSGLIYTRPGGEKVFSKPSPEDRYRHIITGLH